MTFRRRELNVFSISALDLFASGMGAFILLSIMALPFFPNTGDSRDQVEAVQAELAQAIRDRDRVAERARSLEAVLAQVRSDAEDSDALAGALDEALAQVEQAQQKIAELQEVLAAAEASRKAAEAGRKKEAGNLARERALEREVDEIKASLAESRKNVSELEAALAKARIPDMDLVICLDVTSSMTDQIAGLKNEIGTLAQLLDSLAPSVGIGVIAFGDRTWVPPIYERRIVPTSRLAEVRSFVSTLRPEMDRTRNRLNRDGPEMVATAVEMAINSNWRPESERRYVIAITDNAAYPDREAAAIRAAQLFASSPGQFVSTVRANLNDNNRDRRKADLFLRQLAQVGKGQFVDAAGGESFTGSVLLAILGI